MKFATQISPLCNLANSSRFSELPIFELISRPSELESQQSREGGGTSSKEDSFEYPDEGEEIAATSDNNNVDENASGNATSKRNNADQFLVCVFNVSSKVSYSILQVTEYRLFFKYPPSSGIAFCVGTAGTVHDAYT